MILKHLRISLLASLAFTVLTGVLYPALVTGIAQLAFSRQANGSILMRNGAAIGSELIGQQFSDPKYFWSRPSATAPAPYNAASSAASNFGPLNPAYLDSVRERAHALREADGNKAGPIPADLVTTSGSGLDPHISIDAARYQLTRVARARGMSVEQVGSHLDRCTEGRQLGFLGEPRVNVLELNLALDEAKPLHAER